MAADGLPAVARVVRAGARAEPLQRRVRRPRHARASRPRPPACSRPGRPSFGQRFCMISTIEPPGSPADASTPPSATASTRTGSRSSSTASRACCAAMRAEGVTAALHPHVGGWVETEHELRAVLDGVGPDLLAFGPDTGHMSWAGMDVPAVLRDYADRIVGVHLKDTFAAGIARARADDLDYHEATRPGRIWAEPGLGQVDLAACLAAFPDGFAGDYMIEVDVPSLPLRECHQVAYDWALATLPVGESGRDQDRCGSPSSAAATSPPIHLDAILDATPTASSSSGSATSTRAGAPRRRPARGCPGFADLTHAARRRGARRRARLHPAPPARRPRRAVPGPRRLGAAGEAVRAHPRRRRAAGDGRRGQHERCSASASRTATTTPPGCCGSCSTAAGWAGCSAAGRRVHWFRDAAYYARRDWRGRWATAGGGVLMNQAIHTLDLLQWFLGPVTDVPRHRRDAGAARTSSRWRTPRRCGCSTARQQAARSARSSTPPTATSRTPRHRRDRHRARPRPAGHRPDRHPRRRPRRDRPPGHAWRPASGRTGAPRTAC